MTDFALTPDRLALPRGAWAKTHRTRLRHRGATVLALTQGAFRSYAYPVVTPKGFHVTAERPADHPHHASMWIGADNVHALLPTTGGAVETHTYNFYVDETFQGRAPGRIVEVSHAGRETGGDRFEIVQELEWLGPAEWAAGAGRLVARETRIWAVTAGVRFHRIDVASRLRSSDFALRLGPTRHAWFNVRVADSMTVENGGAIVSDRGRGADASGEGARWVDFSGPVGGGHRAGLTVIPRAVELRRLHWFVADWGVMTVNLFRTAALELAPGQVFESRCTVLVHDGEPEIDEIEAVAASQGE